MSSSSKASPSKPLQENKDHPRFPYLQKNQSCGRNVHWMMNITFSFKSKLRLKGFTSQSKIVASSVIMMVTIITKSESHSCFVFTLNNILPACLRELKFFHYSKYKAFSSPSMLDTIVGNNFSLELFHSKNSISLLSLNTLALLLYELNFLSES